MKTTVRRRKAEPERESVRRRSEAQAIASRIRATRRQMRLTLDELAARTELDKGYLSRIERGQKTPSIGTLLKVAAALSVQIGHLFGEKTRADAITVIRHNRRKGFPGTPDRKGPAYEVILPATGTRHLSAFIALPGPEAEIKPVDHPGDELMYVLQGSVRIAFADRVVTLHAGDCAHFDGHLKHQLTRQGAEPAQVLIVVGQDLPAASKAAQRSR
jgi:transcriptional regulator with XRE-family HTH domain